MKKLKAEIAGELIMAEKPGEAMRKWREVFEISQTELSNYLNISPSTISDYESGRRKNPGIKVIKRFVDALFDIDMSRGGKIIKKLQEGETSHEEYFEVREFSKAVPLQDFVSIIQGKVITNEQLIKNINIHGFVILHSIKVMLEMPQEMFKLLNIHAMDKVFVFLDVSTGRSPLIVIRIAPNKPKAVVLHNLDKVDDLAKKISEREKIPIITSKMPIQEMLKKLIF
ncbi:MAG: helix-turn-helix domain-containing protein [Candidatus Anstonellales archaeon]